MHFQQRVLRFWYTKPTINWLKPLSYLMRGVIFIRRMVLKALAPALPVPVIVVGNITLGGTGKTPVMIKLAQVLSENGHHVGIISRGYHSTLKQTPYCVQQSDAASLVGDEPLMMAKRTQFPVMIGRDRVKSIRALKALYPHLTVILSDDGLQHYKMRRAIEIVMIDGQRQLGNENLLPFGPLREPLSRLAEADYVLCTKQVYPSVTLYERRLLPVVTSLCGQRTAKLSDFIGQKVHAVAGIGNPNQFFNMLEAAGLVIQPHGFADHHHFSQNELQFKGDGPVLMTEKDAMKCQDFNLDNTWVVSLEVTIPEAVIEGIKRSL